MTGVAFIDDHESVRLGLEAACARAGELDVVFSGSSVIEYLEWRAYSRAAPADVVVLDLTLGDGTTVTENVRRLTVDGSSVIIHSVEWASAVEGDREFADAQLSARERDVLRLYAAGLPLKTVADRLGVAYSTAKENITRVRMKYVEVGRPAPTKVDLLRRAMEDGILAEVDDADTDAGGATRGG